MVLALLIGGGFLISQKPNTAQAAGAFTQVYHDDFDTSANLGTVWQPVSGTNNNWQINASQLQHKTNSGDTILYGGNHAKLLDGKIEYVVNDVKSGSDVNYDKEWYIH